eukprot:4175338-Amphidinium_carterae.1
MISALTQDGPNSSKIHSTLSHQSPAYYKQLMTIIEAMKSANTQQTSSSSSTVMDQSKSTLNLTVGSEDEVIVKIIKKPKTESQSASGAAASV